MKRFAALVARLEGEGPQARRVDVLCDYLAGAAPADAAWAIRLVAGRGPGRLVRAEALSQAACRAAGVERWLFDACLEASGDIAETIAQVLPPADESVATGLACWLEDRLPALARLPVPQACDQAVQWCRALDAAGRELLVRLMLGRWRAAVDETVLLQALAQHARLDLRLLSLRWPGWTGTGQRPDADRLAALLQPQPTHAQERALAYPFAVLQTVPASALSHAELPGGSAAWVLRGWHGGTRIQLVRRSDGVWLWSASGELLNRRCARIVGSAAALPVDTVLEGELFETGLAVFDLLELGGIDLRDRPYAERLDRARELPLVLPIAQSPAIAFDDASLPGRGQVHPSRGLLALRSGAPYGAPQALLHAPAPPMQTTAAIQTAQWVVDRQGHTRLALGLVLWDGRPRDETALAQAIAAMAAGTRLAAGQPQLVPLARLEIEAPHHQAGGLLEWIEQSTLQRFGPVRLLRPGRVCEIVFDGVQRSARRRSGVCLTGVRLQRWRGECGLLEVDDVQRLRECLRADAGGARDPAPGSAGQ